MPADLEGLTFRVMRLLHENDASSLDAWSIGVGLIVAGAQASNVTRSNFLDLCAQVYDDSLAEFTPTISIKPPTKRIFVDASKEN